MSDFKNIKVRDMRKMIKDLDLKKKNPELKGYSYKKKGQLVEILSKMNIAETDLNKYRSQRKKKNTNMKKKPMKMMVKEVKMMVDPEPEKYKVMFVDKNMDVKTMGEYDSEKEAIEAFDKASRMDNKMKVYVVEFMKGGARQIIRSYKKPMVKMNGKGRFKKHMMFKGKKMEMADTMEEHLELKKKGYTHSKKVNSPKKMNKDKMKYGGY
jgi:hypothetical protein